MNIRPALHNRAFEYIPELEEYESDFDRWESMGVGAYYGDPVQGFIGSEHRDIGDLAVGREPTVIAYGERGELLSFGEVVALAGDYFGTYEEIRDLTTTPADRAIIAWARWHALDLKKQKVPEPRANSNFVMERYYTLASRNLSHFSAGGTGPRTYASWHSKALAVALRAGEENNEKVWRIALTKEAFGIHFLTDIFSAGHVRMPRAQIHHWYLQHLPGDQLLRYMARFLYHQLGKHDQLPLLARIFSGRATNEIKNGIIRLGGAAVKAFSLGDIVALALHNLDGRGLAVVSKRNPDGKEISGGFRWTAVGDGLLGKSANGSSTKMMAAAAVVTSLRDLERVRGMGRKIAGSQLSAAQKSDAVKKALGAPIFAATAFVPKEDTTSGTNIPLPGPRSGKSPLEWRWGRLGDMTYHAVDETVKNQMADNLFDRLNDVNDARIRTALEAFVRHLRAEGIRALERAVGRKAR